MLSYEYHHPVDFVEIICQVNDLLYRSPLWMCLDIKRTPTFSEQPAELFDCVCAFIKQPRDLLSFALTCKHACQVIIPAHMELRHIRCDLLRELLWDKLADSPGIASQFTSLEIADESRLINAILPTHVEQFSDMLTLSAAEFSESFTVPRNFAQV